MKPVLFALFLLLVLPARAGSEKAGPEQAVDGFHAALRQGERDRALSWLHPQLQVFEQGHVDWTREEYARNHLEADLKAAPALKMRRLRREVLELGPDRAAVFTESELGEASADAPSRIATETMLLLRTSGQWQIRHIHWSSRRRNSP